MAFIRIGNLIDGQDVGYWCKQYVEERKKNDELEASFKLYDDAMRRGTRLWQKESGNDQVPRVWPDGAKLAAWLMAQLDLKDEALKAAAIAMDMLAGWKLDERSYIRVMKRYDGGMAGAYIKICEALGTIRVTRKKEPMELREAMAAVKRCMAELESIPWPDSPHDTPFYPPADDHFARAYQELDEAVGQLKSAVKYQDEMVKAQEDDK